jgi:hypothetical protein
MFIAFLFVRQLPLILPYKLSRLFFLHSMIPAGTTRPTAAQELLHQISNREFRNSLDVESYDNRRGNYRG